MRRVIHYGVFITLLFSFTPLHVVSAAQETKPAAASAEPLSWGPWTDDLFARATKENKLVVLDLEAIWCHWCHVMAETTYKDPKVIAFLKEHFLTIRVDQDSRPDLSNRYEDYGWPATIFFAPNGTELAKRSGYIEPGEFLDLVQRLVRNPTPEPDAKPGPKLHYASVSSLTPDQQKRLTDQWLKGYDQKHGGWGFSHKYLDWDSVELALGRAKQGDKRAEQMARKTMAGEIRLVDPAWGGVYQYSVGGDWKEPHFEKIMQMQAENMRIFSLAYAQFRDPAYLRTAQAIYRFLNGFLLSPDGAFYTSQDADLVQGVHSDKYFALGDKARRKQGIPAIDKHVYARENGWAIFALTQLYAATGDETYLTAAKKAAGWIIDHRKLDTPKEQLGFSHDEKDVAGPYLGDTLAMGRAFLNLYLVSAERVWLERAQATARFIAVTFPYEEDGAAAPGFVTVISKDRKLYAPKPLRDENVALARFGNLLSHVTGNKDYRATAERAMRYVATPEVASRFAQAAALLADDELSRPPLHITVVGAKDDLSSKRLFMAALKYPSAYKRLEWWDKREGNLTNPDVTYPQLAKPSAFVCSANRCSAPIQKAEELAMKVEKLVRGTR